METPKLEIYIHEEYDEEGESYNTYHVDNNFGEEGECALPLVDAEERAADWKEDNPGATIIYS